MRSAKLRALSAVLALCHVTGAAAAIDLRNASVEKLDNGMTMILLEDRNFPVVSVQMLYRVGARNESSGETGIAHFVEHMAFRDTRNFADTGVVSSIYARGGEWHGYTWTDETTYFATVPKEHLDLLLRIEAERMARLEIQKADMEAERGAVLAEMHMYENYPTSMLLDAVIYTSFLAHPYRNNTIGWESDIENITHADVVGFWRTHYQPANAVLAVVGDFDAESTAARIRELFGVLPGGEPTPPPHTVEPVQEGERRVRLFGNTERKRFMIAWRAPSANDPDYAAFLVLQEVLGASSGVNFAQNDWGSPVGEDSVLHGAAADMTTWYPPSAQDYLFVIGGSADADADEAAVEAEISEPLERLRQRRIGQAELTKAIDAVKDQLAYDVETTEDAAHQLAFFAGLGALDTLFELPARIEAVAADDVRRAARRWLLPRRRTIGWYVPGTGGQASAPATAREETEVELPPPAPVDDVPVPAPVVRTLGGGIPAIVQRSDMSPGAQVMIVLAGRDIEGEKIEADEPVLGYSSLSWRIRPAELAATLVKARGAADRAPVARRADEASAGGPEVRLEQAFAKFMSTGTDEASTAPALIVVTGDVGEDATFALLEEHFGDLAPPPPGSSAAASFDVENVEIALGHPVAQAQLGYLVPAPGPSDPASRAWALLLYVLSHGYEGRLGKAAISNRGLAYYIDSRYRSNGVDGWITIAVGVAPHKLGDLEQLMVAELERLETEPPTAAEVAEAKAHLVGREISAAQSNAELARALATEWIWYGEVTTPEELEAALADIDRQDVLDAISAFTDGITIKVTE